MTGQGRRDAGTRASIQQASVRMSQGAKLGLGGQLMAKKVTPGLACIRGIPYGIDLRSPSRHPGILGGDDLLIKPGVRAKTPELRVQLD